MLGHKSEQRVFRPVELLRLLIAGDFHGDDRNIGAGIDLGPALCCQGGIDGSLDPIKVQSIFRLNLRPRVGLVSREVRAAIVVGSPL